MTGNTNHASFAGKVSADVSGTKAILEQDVRVALTYDETNYVVVDVLWQYHGYKNDRQLGLYGWMNTRYESAVQTASREFRVINQEYSVTIRY
jgi:hypothetical protein